MMASGCGTASGMADGGRRRRTHFEAAKQVEQPHQILAQEAGDHIDRRDDAWQVQDPDRRSAMNGGLCDLTEVIQTCITRN